MRDLLQRLRPVIARRRLIAQGEPALVAVSGGVDSMVLRHALAELGKGSVLAIDNAHFLFPRRRCPWSRGQMA